MCLASTNGEIEHWLFTLLLKQEFSLILGRSCKTHFNGDINFIEYLVFSILLNQQYHKSAFVLSCNSFMPFCRLLNFKLHYTTGIWIIRFDVFWCVVWHFQSSLNKTHSILFFLNISISYILFDLLSILSELYESNLSMITLL